VEVTLELTAEQILGASDLPLEKCPCPEWGGHIYIKTLNSLERSALDVALWSDKKLEEPQRRAILLTHCGCNAAGKLLFTPEQAEALTKKNGMRVAELARTAQRLNYISEARAKEIEKNSETQPSDSGSS